MAMQVSSNQMGLQRSQLTAMEEIRAQLNELRERDRAKDAAISKLSQDVSALQQRLIGLEDTRLVGAVAPTGPSEAEKRAVAKMVKNAVTSLYGETKTSTSVSVTEQTQEMRWNYLQTATSRYNHQQTQRVISMIKDNRESIPMPADIPCASVPLYSDATDLFHEALQAVFRQNQAAYKRNQIAEWGAGTVDGPRA